VIVNFANCDMVGHTGVFAAAVKAVETVDSCLGRIVEETISAGGFLLVTADHGNAEEMIDRVTGGPMTAHTKNPVPIVLVVPEDDPVRHIKLRTGSVLSSIAPTVLDLLRQPCPVSMDQPSLLAGLDLEG
jgi:2,3-bisphosphoglycerate-independent phosphoglycerate mutase